LLLSVGQLIPTGVAALVNDVESLVETDIVTQQPAVVTVLPWQCIVGVHVDVCVDTRLCGCVMYVCVHQGGACVRGNQHDQYVNVLQ
jgi:hypothetical protein